MTKWKQTTKERFWEMLEILPPAIQTGRGFLVGEPWRHKDGDPAYQAHVQIGEKYYEADEPMTIAEFQAYQGNPADALVLDERDSAIRAERLALFDSIDGPRVGDWIRMLDGSVRRFTHDWDEDGLQVQTPLSVCGPCSFYFTSSGHQDYSGGMDPIVPLTRIVRTTEIKPGPVWFFHHGIQRAHNGVYTDVPCRVYLELAD